MLDMILDLVMIKQYADAGQMRYARPLLVMVCANIFFQALLVPMQKSRLGMKAVMIDTFYVLTLVFPGMHAYRLSVGVGKVEMERMEPTVYNFISRGAVLVAESIPGLMLQMHAFMTIGSCTGFALPSILFSALSAGFSVASLYYDFECNYKFRKQSPMFIGGLPHDEKSDRTFFYIFLFSVAHVLNRAICLALFWARFGGLFVLGMHCVETLIFLAIRAAQGNIMIWVPFNGFAPSVTAGLLSAIIQKTLIDVTGYLQLRAPVNSGGILYTATVTWAQVTTILSAVLYLHYPLPTTDSTTSTDGDDREESATRKMTAAELYPIVLALSVVWAFSFYSFAKKLNPEQHSRSFLSTTTASQFVVQHFRAGDDHAKHCVFSANVLLWAPIKEDVKAWVLEGWETWEEKRPDWFTEEWKSTVPDEFKTSSLPAGGTRSRRVSPPFNSSGDSSHKPRAIYKDRRSGDQPDTYITDLKYLESLTLSSEDADDEVLFTCQENDEIYPIVPADQLIYRLEERLDLIEAYKLLSLFNKTWTVPASSYKGVMIKTGFIGRLYYGYSVGEVPATLPMVFDFIWGFLKPGRVNYNTLDIYREVVCRIGPQCQITYNAKHVGPLVTPRDALVNWLYVEFPDNRVLISQKSCTHRLKPEDPRFIRGFWRASILLTPIRGGSGTSVRFVCRSDPRGKIPEVLVRQRFHLLMSLIWEARHFFANKSETSSFAPAPPTVAGTASSNNRSVEPSSILSDNEPGIYASDDLRELFFKQLDGATPTAASLSKVASTDPTRKTSDITTHEKRDVETFTNWCQRQLKITKNASNFRTYSRLDTEINNLFSELMRNTQLPPPKLDVSETLGFEKEFRVYNMMLLHGEPTSVFMRRGATFSIVVFIFAVVIRTALMSGYALFWETTNVTPPPDDIIHSLWWVPAFLVLVAPWGPLYVVQRRHLSPGNVFPSFRAVESIERAFIVVYLLSSVGFLLFLISAVVRTRRMDSGKFSHDFTSLTSTVFSPEGILLCYLLENSSLFNFSVYMSADVYSKILGFKCLAYIMLVVVNDYAVQDQKENTASNCIVAAGLVFFTYRMRQSVTQSAVNAKAKFALLWRGFSEKYNFDRKRRGEISGLTPEQTSLLNQVELQAKAWQMLGGVPFVRAIHHLSIEFEEQIGVGKFGVIYLGIWRSQHVVVKALSSSDVSASLISSFVEELYVLSSLHHPNILACYGAVLSSPFICIVTEYCKRGDLKRVLRRKTGMSWLQRKKGIVSSVCEAMSYLSARYRPVAHHDLNTGNCLVTEDWTVKLTGFRNARCVPPEGMKSQPSGLPIFMAPEMLLQDSAYNELADVFAFGMLLVDVAIDGFAEKLIENNLLERNVLPHETLTREAFTRVVCNGWRVKLPTHWKIEIPRIVDIIDRCLSHNPADRPSFSQIRFWLSDWNGQLAERERGDTMTTVHPYDNAERALLVEGRKLIQRAAERDWVPHVTLIESLANQHASNWSTKAVVEDGVTTVLGKCSRNIPFKSFQVLEFMWDWLHPKKLWRNTVTKTEVARSVFDVLNEHHLVVYSKINFMASTRASANVAALRGRLTKESANCDVVCRVVWKEIEPRCYILTGTSVDVNAYKKHCLPNPSARVNVSWCMTITGLPDGTCDADLVCSLTSSTLAYRFISANILTLMFRHTLTDCCAYLEDGSPPAINVVRRKSSSTPDRNAEEDAVATWAAPLVAAQIPTQRTEVMRERIKSIFAENREPEKLTPWSGMFYNFSNLPPFGASDL